VRITALARDLHPRSPLWTICGLHLAILLLAILPASSHASDEDAKLLLAALASDDCESRLEGLSRYSRSDDNERHRNAALKRLSSGASPSLKEQVFSLLALMEDGRKGSARILALTEKASRLDTLDKAGRDRSLRQMRQELLQIIGSPKEPIAARIGASWPLVRILLAAIQDHPEWKTEWAQSLETMLKSSDGPLRVVGAATAALRRFPEGSDPAKADVVRPLIDGLRHDSVSVRSSAYLGLRQALDGIGARICFGASDSPDRRAASIRQWEEWWNGNRQELARDRVVQRFW